jgi:hypothetical protein
MAKQIIFTEQAPKPPPYFSQAVKSGVSIAVIAEAGQLVQAQRKSSDDHRSTLSSL